MTTVKDMQERMRKQRERLQTQQDIKTNTPLTATSGSSPSTPSVETQKGISVKGVRWYETVRNDMSRMQEAFEYFQKVAKDAEPHLAMIGNLQTLVAETPGLTYFYRAIHTDAQQIRRFLEERLEIDSAVKYKWYTGTEARVTHGDLKVTDINKFVKADPAIAELSMLIKYAAYYDHLLEDICESMANRSIMLSHITTIRKENLQEVFIDPTTATREL